MPNDGRVLSENKALVERFLKDLDEDIGAIDDFFAPGCRAHLPGSNLPVDREGFKIFVGMLYAATPQRLHEELKIGPNRPVLISLCNMDSGERRRSGFASCGPLD
jgi:hypothetical protein